jgi:shikimate kinase
MTGRHQLHNLALIGFMGTGKSSVGRRAASVLGYDFVDTDDLIEERVGKPITQIFQEGGENSFRELEQQLVSEMSSWKRKVIATGGGLVTHSDNLVRLKTHALVVCLWASAEAIWQRVRNQAHRPLLSGPDPTGTITNLLDQRRPFYRQADVLVNTDTRSLHEVTQQVVHQFQVARQQPDQSENLD